MQTATRPDELHVKQLRAALDELANAVLLSGGDDVILRFLLLQHQPLHFDVVPCVSPVAPGVQVAEVKLLLKAGLDAGKAAGDLASNERLSAQGGFVVEENAVAGI